MGFETVLPTHTICCVRSQVKTQNVVVVAGRQRLAVCPVEVDDGSAAKISISARSAIDAWARGVKYGSIRVMKKAGGMPQRFRHPGRKAGSEAAHVAEGKYDGQKKL
jgi:hypothetical protein